MAKLKNNQLLGAVLLVSVILPYIPIVNAIAELGRLAIFIVAIYLLIKG
jgi:hypothetical protein